MAPKMAFRRCVCRILVVVILFVIIAKMVFHPIPIWSLNMISRAIPEASKMDPTIIDSFRYFAQSMSFLKIVEYCESIKNNPNNPKKSMSFPFDEPIKK